MSLTYQVVPREILAGPEKGVVKYYGHVRAGKRISYKRMCRQIAMQSAATRGDVQLIIDNFVDLLLVYLEAGNVVPVGDLGSFRMSAGSRGAGTEEEFNASYMKKGKVIFYPGVELKELEKNVKYERFKPDVKYVDNEEDKEPNPFP